MKKLTFTLFIFLTFISFNVCQSQWFLQHPYYCVNDNLNLSDIQQVSANVVYAVGTQGLILKSTNGGNNWLTIPCPINIQLRDLYFVNENTGFICSNEGRILKTTNGGNNWTVTIIPNVSAFMTIKFLNVNTGLTTGIPGRIYRTTNSGNNWVIVHDSTTEMRRISFRSDTAYAVGYTGKLLKSTNAGLNWFRINSGGDYFYIAIDNNSNGGIILGGGSEIISRTSNNGSNWQNYHYTPFSQTPFYSVKYLGDNIFISGTTGFIGKSTNGGANFNPVITNVNDLFMHSLSFLNENTGFACMGYDYESSRNGGILKTTNGGNSWETLLKRNLTGFPSFIDSYFSDSLNGWATTASRTIQKTTDGGKSWSTIYSAGIDLHEIDFIGNIGFVGADNGKIVRTTNGGNNWEQLSTSFSSAFFGIKMFNVNTIVAGGYIGYTARSTNQGASWTVERPCEESIYSMFRLNETTGFMTADGRILRTTNAGASWSTAYFFPFNYLFNLDISPSGLGIAVGENVIVRSTNNGTSWSSIASDISGYYSDIKITNGAMYACSYSGALVRSTNNGVNWTSETSLMNTSLNNIQIFRNTGIVLGNSGAVLKSYNILTDIQPVSSIVPDQFNLKQNYPNPFNPETKIKFSLKTKGDVLLEVYSTAGELISTLVKSNLNAGEYEYTWNAGNFPSGVYFYRLKTEGFTDTKKMILLK